MNGHNLVKLIGSGLAALFFAVPAFAIPHFAVWLDGAATDGGNPIFSRLNTAFGAGSATLVTTAQLATPGFLSAFDTVVVSRFDASFGTGLSAAAAANILAYVGAFGPTQGGVALFTNDMADNLMGGPDPFDTNLDHLFINAATSASATHHGYIGEFNGAAMALTANGNGFAPIGLLPGVAGTLGSYGGTFVYDVGPIGPGNPIDAGVAFPFTDADTSTFLTHVTGALPSTIVDIYTSAGIVGLPAVLANAGAGGGGAPEPASLALLGIAAAAMFGVRRRTKQ